MYQISFYHFFSALFNKSKAFYLKRGLSQKEKDTTNDLDQDTDTDESLKIKSLFQILYYHIHKGRKKTPLHLINAHAIYERCKSRELITAFNKQSVCVSYKVMKQEINDLAKYSIIRSSNGVPLPSNFSPASFTIGAFDNFDHSDRNSMSGAFHAQHQSCSKRSKRNYTEA